MADAILSILAIAAMLLLAGGIVGLARRDRFRPRWLGVAALLVVANDAALTRCYGVLPDMVGGERNWQGKLLALALTLAVAALPTFGWRRIGLTLAQRREGLRGSLGAAALLALVFVGIALALPPDPTGAENLAFQLTMPGLEEEFFYRGLLLLALDRAFSTPEGGIGWGGLLSCAIFGLAHGFTIDAGTATFAPLAFALTGGPALLLVWLRARTGSLLLPVALHNAANTLLHLL